MFRLPPVDDRIVFLDTEFTTLDKRRRQVWELAAIVRDPGKEDVEVEWQVRPDLTDASPDSCRIGRYYRRCRIQDRAVGAGLVIVGPGWDELEPDVEPEHERFVHAAEIAATVAPMLDGSYVVGAVPSADELALDRFLSEWNQLLTVHYRLRCVETLALGYVHGMRAERATVPGRAAEQILLVEEIPAPPWDTATLSRLVGVEPPSKEKAHRALVDARWTRDVWDAVHGLR